MTPPASVIFPTRGRFAYLEVALASVAPQARAHGAEIVVVEDDPEDPATRALVERRGGRYVAHGEPRGINVARNTGIEAATGDLLCFLDDDVEVWPTWLDAVLRGAAAHPGTAVFGGPIRPRLEGGDLRACGREPLPVTSLDLGRHDTDADVVWGANMVVRRAAFERHGRFDPALGGAGDEEHWQRGLKASGERIRYLAAAGVDHRRAGPDARLRALARAQFFRGRASRRFDRFRGEEPRMARELRVLAGCVVHTVRYRCGNGIVMAAHSAGRIAEAGTTPRAAQGPDFLSGESGTLGRRTTALGIARDLAADAVGLPRRVALLRAARDTPRRRVLAVAIARPERAGSAAAAAQELERSRRHDVTVRLSAPRPGAGKWANLAGALTTTPPDGSDWLLIFDDDVVLPWGFLDGFLFCCERFGFVLAQPAHKHWSNAAWRVTRRRAATVARRSRFVEIGPVTAIHRTAFEELLPFPPLQMGWGLDAHWSALAERNGWPLGIVDATPIRHTRPVAGDYPREAALQEAERFLANRPYIRRDQAQETVQAHVRW
jgi:GT2 family glycosyltransferase